MTIENLDEFHAAISDAVSSLDSLIALYTTQLEEYERLSANYIMTCVGFGGVVFGIIITLLELCKKKNMDAVRGADAECFVSVNEAVLQKVYEYCVNAGGRSFCTGCFKILQ